MNDDKDVTQNIIGTNSIIPGLFRLLIEAKAVYINGNFIDNRVFWYMYSYLNASNL